MHSAIKREILDQFKSVELAKREALYRQIRQVIVQLVKIAKLTTLYPMDDPVYDDLVKTMKENLDAVANTLPVCAVNVKKVGFYYVEKRLKIFDEGEKDLRNLFVANETRELAFLKGITPQEIRDFFGIIGKTISYTGSEYDLNTMLWDHDISHIVCLASEDTGEGEPFAPADFENAFSPFPPPAPMNLQEMAQTARTFDSVFRGGAETFKEFLQTNGERFSVQRYLTILSRLILSDEDHQATLRFLTQIIDYTHFLLLSRRFTYGMDFFATLSDIGAKLAENRSPLHERVATEITRITSPEFTDKMFDLAVKAPSEEYEGFSSFVGVVSPLRFEQVLLRITGLNVRELRLLCLKTVAKDFGDITVAKRLLGHEDWRVVRNTLYLMRFVKNEYFVPLIREVMNHPQRQVRLEAVVALSSYNADDNLPYWQKAIFSPDREIRLVAMKNVVRIKDIQAKGILDSILRPQNIGAYPLDEVIAFFGVIVSSKRPEFFDLVAVHIFAPQRPLRMAAINAIREMPPTESVWRIIAKRVGSEEFRDLDHEEIERTVLLIREDAVHTILPSLEYLFTLQGGLFDRGKYRFLKEITFGHIGRFRKVKFVQRWLEKAYLEGNRETKNVIEKFGITVSGNGRTA